jgi:hypothetical protein
MRLYFRVFMVLNLLRVILLNGVNNRSENILNGLKKLK